MQVEMHLHGLAGPTRPISVQVQLYASTVLRGCPCQILLSLHSAQFLIKFPTLTFFHVYAKVLQANDRTS